MSILNCLIRRFTKGHIEVVNIKDYGAKGDGITDDTSAIQVAIQHAAQQSNQTLYFPAAERYKITSTIHVPVGISVQIDAPILFTGDNESAALTIGDSGAVNQQLRHRLNIINDTISDWSSEESVGIRLYNANACHIDVVQVEGFTIGVQCIGAGQGFMYNQTRLGSLLNNKIGLDLTNETANGKIGCTNENLFLNGRFTNWSETNPGISRYGIRITSIDETYTDNNNNLFIKPSFELVEKSATQTWEAIPILVEHGVDNRFESCRDEINSNIFARVLNKSYENEFHVGYGPIYTRIDDQSQTPSSRATSRQSRLIAPGGNVIFLSGPLHKRACYYEGKKIHVPGLHLTDSSSHDIFPALDGIDITDDYLKLPSSRGVGIFVNTSRLKRFVVRSDVDVCDDSKGGRIYVRCYDTSGSILQDTAGGSHVTGNVFRQPYFSTNYGGAYVTGSNSPEDYFFQVTDEVKQIDVFLSGGEDGGEEKPLRIRCFAIYAVDNGMAATWAGYEEGVPGRKSGRGSTDRRHLAGRGVSSIMQLLQSANRLAGSAHREVHQEPGLPLMRLECR